MGLFNTTIERLNKAWVSSPNLFVHFFFLPLMTGVSASDMLQDFCRFKQSTNIHHDVALLLTREQICRNPAENNCDTLGLAELGTICRDTACAIVQDNGLSASFTIAHELGHV